MVTFLLTVAVLSVLIVAGYRLNMYLYARGAFGTHTRTLRQMQSIGQESLSVSEGDVSERDYGLRYARTGILLIVAVMAVLATGLIVLLLAMVH